MSGEFQDVTSSYVPAPVDGLNLRTSVYELGPKEAIQLDNYLVFDWGIRECGNFSALTQPTTGAIGQLIYFKDTNGAAMQLICMANKVYSVNNANWSTPTNLTGALTITSDAWRYCFFKKRIFMVNATNVGLIYSISGSTLAADTWTGLTTDNASQVFSYKQRVYYIQKNSTSVWYGPVSSVAGALTEFDVGEFLEDYGTLLFGCSWSVNQGQQNEQLFVLVTLAGEVLIYSGDYPAAPNWTILTRVQIPTPIGNQAFIRLGQDILIVTYRGVISLAGVVSGRYEEEPYYNTSLKLGDSFGSVNVKPARDPRLPFLYFASSSAQYIFALNFERGAWSRIDTTVGSGTIGALSFFDNGVTGNYLNVAFSNQTSKLLDDTAGNTATHAWRTGLMNIEPTRQKHVKFLRVYCRNISGTAQIANSVSVRMDNLFGSPSTDNRTTDISALTPALSGYGYSEQQLNPNGLGKRPSIIFSKTSTGEQNEIAGLDLFYSKTGGAF